MSHPMAYVSKSLAVRIWFGTGTAPCGCTAAICAHEIFSFFCVPGYIKRISLSPLASG
jgi:hypothetical protein